MVNRRLAAEQSAGGGGGISFEFVGPTPPPALQREEPQRQRVDARLEDCDHLRFNDDDAVRTAAKRKGWMPFTNRSNGERGFFIPEVPDSVVYASWERGLGMLPRADEWLRERRKEVPATLAERLQGDPEEAEAERQRVADEAERLRKQAEEERRKAEEELEKKRLEEEEEKQRAEQEAERLKKLAEEEKRRAEEAQVNEELDMARQLQRDMLERREKERADAEAKAAADRLRAETRRFLRREHGKQAYAHLAHEGALDREVWDRPDDELKRLGFVDSFHVASGGGSSALRAGGTLAARRHVKALEGAVRESLSRSHSPAPRGANVPRSPAGLQSANRRPMSRCPSLPNSAVGSRGASLAGSLAPFSKEV